MPAGDRRDAGAVQRHVVHRAAGTAAVARGTAAGAVRAAHDADQARRPRTPRSRARDAQRLVWVLGIGKMVGYTLLLEIDDIARFPSVRHFHSYCRLVPGSHGSGGKTRHKRSRDGNRYLKIAFHHAAIRAIQYFPEVKAEFQRWQRRKGKPRSSRKNSPRSCMRCCRKANPSTNSFSGKATRRHRHSLNVDPYRLKVIDRFRTARPLRAPKSRSKLLVLFGQ